MCMRLREKCGLLVLINYWMGMYPLWVKQNIRYTIGATSRRGGVRGEGGGVYPLTFLENWKMSLDFGNTVIAFRYGLNFS